MLINCSFRFFVWVILMKVVEGKNRDTISYETGLKKPKIKDIHQLSDAAGIDANAMGTVNVGSDVLWWRHRRPAELYEEAMRMLADMTGKSIRIDEEGLIHKKEATEQDQKDAGRIRAFKMITAPIMDSQIGNVFINKNGIRSDTGKPVTFEDVRRGIKIDGIPIKDSIVLHSQLDRGSQLKGSLVYHAEGLLNLVDAYVQGKLDAEDEGAPQRGRFKELTADETILYKVDEPNEAMVVKPTPGPHGKQLAYSVTDVRAPTLQDPQFPDGE